MTDQQRAKEALITQKSLRSFNASDSPRVNHVMQSLVRHLHGFVSEVGLTQREWKEGVGFLTDTGHACDKGQQEFMQLSDVLGVSLLVEAIRQRQGQHSSGVAAFGPIYVDCMPNRHCGKTMAFTDPAPALVRGRVLDAHGQPLVGASVEVRLAQEKRLDNDAQPSALLGRFDTDSIGCFEVDTWVAVSNPLRTDGPVGTLLQAARCHPWQPSHLRFRIDMPGYRTTSTQLFFSLDPFLQADSSLAEDPCPQQDICLAPDFATVGADIRLPSQGAYYEFILQSA